MSLQQLRDEYKTCTCCQELCKSRSQVVFGSGDEKAKILFIGEAPGASEDKQGIPFCGASGQVLQDLLAGIDLTRDDVFITNTILCRPENNRNPKSEEVENCRERLDKTIEIMQPDVIVTIGNFATQRIIGKTGITKIRGKIFDITINDKDYKVVPVIHPANLLYNGRSPVVLEGMQKDFQVIASLLGVKLKSDEQKPKETVREPSKNPQAKLFDF
jgi:uracil-DNA glycosylase